MLDQPEPLDLTYIAIRIAAGLWLLWAAFAIYLANRILRDDLRYLFEPNVDLMSGNNSSSRYDQIRTRKCEIIFGAVFLLPFRIMIGFVFIPLIALHSCFVFYFCCSKLLPNFRYKKKLLASQKLFVLSDGLVAKELFSDINAVLLGIY